MVDDVADDRTANELIASMATSGIVPLQRSTMKARSDTVSNVKELSSRSRGSRSLQRPVIYPHCIANKTIDRKGS